MNPRTAAWLAWSLCAVSLLLLAVSLLMVILGWSTPLPGDWLWEEQAIYVVLDLGAPLLGAFVASNRPGNPYGWAWLGFGMSFALSAFGQNYALYALWVQPGSLPAPGLVLVVATAAWVAGIVILPFLLLLFPDGRLPSPRWRIVAWVVAFAGGMLLLLGMFRLDTVGPIKNPLGVEGAVGEAIVAVTDAGLYVIFAAGILCPLSLVSRYRRASGIERQQIKWFAYAAALFGVVIAVSLVIDDLLGLDPPLPYMVWVLLNNVPIAALYVAVGVAVLKYRLYEIDAIINRTIVYGTLTGTLALMYFGGVTVTQAIFRGLTGQQEQQSQLAIVVSTLVIAALFNPLRRWVQAFVDRRFYRRKYDAAKTLEAFSAKLRDETDLEALNDDLVGVVRETMQPAHVSLWLHPDRIRDGSRHDRRVDDGGDSNKADANR